MICKKGLRCRYKIMCSARRPCLIRPPGASWTPAPQTSCRSCRRRAATSLSKARSAKLDKIDLLILDDIAYAEKDQAETSVLFELIARRYETRSLAIAANQPFSAWDRVFPDKAVTVAAIDRLVHHATILEMNVDSYRRRAAVARRQDEADAPPTTSDDSLADNQKGAD